MAVLKKEKRIVHDCMESRLGPAQLRLLKLLRSEIFKAFTTFFPPKFHYYTTLLLRCSNQPPAPFYSKKTPTRRWWWWWEIDFPEAACEAVQWRPWRALAHASKQ
jgi:hypothetical protein